MKKAFVLFVAMALTMAMASVAMAEITMDGSIEFLLRSVKNSQDWNDETKGAGDFNLTYERLRIGINAKHEGVKGRIQIENDWDVWGNDAVAAPQVATTSTTNSANPGFEGKTSNQAFYAREAWLDFNMPFGIPGHIKVGRQFLQLGNGWFFRSNKYGSDAWVIGFPGKNTFAFVNVKAAENNSAASDDTDAYVLLDTFKIDDKNAVGAYFAHIKDRNNVWMAAKFGAGAGDTTLQNLGVFYNGVVGPIKLAAEVDMQMGEINEGGSPTTDFKGNQLVVQAGMSMDALSLRATAAMGSGQDPASTANELGAYLPFLDKDPHYTLVYEYFMETACGLGLTTNTGFCNTTALSIGADFKINDMITVGADLWILSATEKVLNGAGNLTDDLGNEIDVKVNLKLADQLTWNTTIGQFMSGKAYDLSATQSADDVTAVQSVLSYKF